MKLCLATATHNFKWAKIDFTGRVLIKGKYKGFIRGLKSLDPGNKQDKYKGVIKGIIKGLSEGYSSPIAG